MALALQFWLKTQEALELIQEQKVFCVEGMLLQGYQGAIFTVKERQLTDEELHAVRDVDGTISKVLKVRRQRLELKYMNRSKEYDERRARMREQRSAIRSSIVEDKSLGLPIAEADLKEIESINARMNRLQDLSTQESIAALDERIEGAPEVEEREQRLECKRCGELSPEGHNAPKRWLTGHNMACLRKSAKAS